MSNKLRIVLAAALLGGTLGTVGLMSAASAAPIGVAGRVAVPAPTGIEQARWVPVCRTVNVRTYRYGRPVMVSRRQCRRVWR